MVVVDPTKCNKLSSNYTVRFLEVFSWKLLFASFNCWMSFAALIILFIIILNTIHPHHISMHQFSIASETVQSMELIHNQHPRSYSQTSPIIRKYSEYVPSRSSYSTYLWWWTGWNSWRHLPELNKYLLDSKCHWKCQILHFDLILVRSLTAFEECNVSTIFQQFRTVGYVSM